MPKLTISPSNLSCGLDFGTSNSVISLTDTTTLKEVFSYSVSSILYFPDTKDDICFIGKEAQEKYVEDGMTGRLLKSVKTLLPQDSFLFTWIGGKRVTPDQLVTYIISHLKKKAEEFAGFPIESVVLGRPAIFSEDPKKEKVAVDRLLLAASNSGFKNIKLQPEPIAAAFSYEQTLHEDETVLVADFGGGTSDFTIIKLSPSNVGKTDRTEDIVTHGGVYIGGDLFDSEIMWHKVTPQLGRGVQYKSYDKKIEVPNTLYRELRNWERSFLLKESKARKMMDKYYTFSDKDRRIGNVRTLVDKNYVFSLFKKIEKAKITLSEEAVAHIRFSKDTIHIDEPFRFEEFENIISTHIDSIEKYIRNLLQEAGYNILDIDSVFLTGGTSLALPIQKALNNIFGKEKVHQGDTFHSVAYGLSLSYLKSNKE